MGLKRERPEDDGETAPRKPRKPRAKARKRQIGVSNFTEWVDHNTFYGAAAPASSESSYSLYTFKKDAADVEKPVGRTWQLLGGKRSDLAAMAMGLMATRLPLAAEAVAGAASVASAASGHNATAAGTVASIPRSSQQCHTQRAPTCPMSA